MFEEIKIPAGAVPNAPPGSVIVFADENGRPSFKDENGNVFGMAFRGGFTPRWKNDIVGNLFVGGDTVAAQINQSIQCQVATGQFLTVNFPAADANSAGREFQLVSHADKKVDEGNVILVPDTGDRIGSLLADQEATLADAELFGVTTFISDGNGAWHMSTIGGNLFLVEFVPPP